MLLVEWWGKIWSVFFLEEEKNGTYMKKTWQDYWFKWQEILYIDIDNKILPWFHQFNVQLGNRASKYLKKKNPMRAIVQQPRI